MQRSCLIKGKVLKASCLRMTNWGGHRIKATKQQFKASDGLHYCSEAITNVEKANVLVIFTLA